MLGSLFKKSPPKHEQSHYSSAYFVQTCAVFLMKEKPITPRQNYVLINHINSNSTFEGKTDAAMYVTRTMAALQEKTNFSDYISYSKLIEDFDKKYRMEIIENLYLFLLLGKDSSDLMFHYINNIAERVDIGTLNYIRAVKKAEKRNKNINIPEDLTKYTESLDIIRDALSRSNFQ